MLGKPPETVPTPDELSAKEFFDLGIWYEDEKQLSKARKCYEQTIEKEPDSALARDAKRALYLRIPIQDVTPKSVDRIQKAILNLRFKPNEALKMTKLALEENPEYESAHRMMALIHLQNGNLEKCKESIAAALRINPNHAPAWATMARVCAVDMDYPEATKYLRMAREFMPDDAELNGLERSIEYLEVMEQEV